MNLKTKRLIRSLAQFVLAISSLLFFRWMVFEPFVIPSGSMIPSLLVRDHIVVKKYVYGLRLPFTQKWLVRWGQVQRGDIIVFRYPPQPDIFYVKRAVAIGGDRVELDRHGQLFVNGDPVDRQQLVGSPLIRPADAELGNFEEPRFYREDSSGRSRTIMLRPNARSSFGPFKVPKGHVFVLGDNRDNSRDSRFWGTLDENLLIGEASMIWLSCYQTLKSAPFVCDPSQLRWDRMFKPVQ